MNQGGEGEKKENRLKLTGHIIEMEFGILKHVPGLTQRPM